METWTETDKFGFKERYSSAAQLIRPKLRSNGGHGIDLLCILITSLCSGERNIVHGQSVRTKVWILFFTDNACKNLDGYPHIYISPLSPFPN